MSRAKSRRAILGAFAAASVAAVPAIAAAPSSAVAAAIERHRAAHDAYKAACARATRYFDPPEIDETYDAEIAALKALVDTPCASADDLVKKLEYLLSYEDSFDPEHIGIRDDFATLVYAMRSYLRQAA